MKKNKLSTKLFSAKPIFMKVYHSQIKQKEIINKQFGGDQVGEHFTWHIMYFDYMSFRIRPKHRS